MDKVDKPGVSDTTREKEECFCSETEAQEASITGLSADTKVHHSWAMTHTYTYTHMQLKTWCRCLEEHRFSLLGVMRLIDSSPQAEKDGARGVALK